MPEPPMIVSPMMFGEEAEWWVLPKSQYPTEDDARAAFMAAEEIQDLNGTENPIDYRRIETRWMFKLADDSPRRQEEGYDYWLDYSPKFEGQEGEEVWVLTTH